MRRKAALAALVVSLITAPSAAASYDPVGSGVTTLTLSSQFRSLLAADQVKVHTGAGASLHGARVRLPAVGGEVDPKRGSGTVESAGTIEFAAGPRKVKLRGITFKAKRAPLYAKVGGGQLKLVTARGLSAKRSGFGSSFSAVGLRLTAKVAERLNKKLRLRTQLRAGQLVGKLSVSAQPTTVHLLPTGRLSLNLDQAFYAKLNKQFVSVNPIAPAELGAGPVLSFPIGPESIISPDGTRGLLKLGGSVELLQLGSAQYFWRQLQLEPEVAALASETDLEPSPPQAGRSAESPLLSVQPGLVQADPESRVVGLSGLAAALPASTAAALNAAFAEGKPLFAPGELVGTISASLTAE
jgi:hypothetical protein